MIQRFRVLHTGFIAIILLASLLCAACGGSSSAGTLPAVDLQVFAAASLNGAFTAIGTAYHKQRPNVTLTFNFAGSQQLAQQITQGAPVDVFASANTSQMAVVVKGGQIAAAAPQTFVHNRLVVITPKQNPANIQQLQDLAKPGLKIVLADKSVPVGGYALTFLQKASADPAFSPDYQTKVLANVVSYEQDVTAVFSKAQLGDADAGIVYTSDVSVHGDQVHELAIPDTLNVIADYPIAPAQASTHRADAQAFIAYVLSPDGQAILKQYGFIGV